MRLGGVWLLAVLASGFACQSEVALHLFKDHEASTVAGGSSVGGSAEAGEAGTGAAGVSTGGVAGQPDAGGGDSNASGGEAGSSPTAPCQKVGPEVCNGADDDCDGHIDDGCDYTIVWSNGPNAGTIGHATGGVTFLEPCGVGTVMTGLHVGMGKWLNQVAAICSQVVLHVDPSQSAPFSVTLGQRGTGVVVPSASGDPKNHEQDMSCPTGSIVSGINGTTSQDEAHYILGLRLSCSPPIVTTLMTGSILDYDATLSKSVGPVVCVTCMASQAENFSTTIAPGHVANGIFGGDGLWDDRVGFSSALGTIANH